LYHRCSVYVVSPVFCLCCITSVLFVSYHQCSVYVVSPVFCLCCITSVLFVSYHRCSVCVVSPVFCLCCITSDLFVLYHHPYLKFSILCFYIGLVVVVICPSLKSSVTMATENVAETCRRFTKIIMQ